MIYTRELCSIYTKKMTKIIYDIILGTSQSMKDHIERSRIFWNMTSARKEILTHNTLCLQHTIAFINMLLQQDKPDQFIESLS